jgi:hypothetical protein
MKCDEVRTLLSQINDRQDTILPISSSDLIYLTTDGYLKISTKEDYDKEEAEVTRLSQMMTDLDAERAKQAQASHALGQDEQKEHSFLFHFEGKEEKDQLQQRVAEETSDFTEEVSKLNAEEANVNLLIQKKSNLDRMVPYQGDYLSLTDLGKVILNDLNVRNYRLADQDFSEFQVEIKETYGALRSICEKASAYVTLIKPIVPKIEGSPDNDARKNGQAPVEALSLLWSVAIGLAKLEGDTNQIEARFAQSLGILRDFGATPSNKLMAAEIMTAAIGNQDVRNLESDLKILDRTLRNQDVPKELSAGVATTIMAGRRFDGSYPLDRFNQFKQLTPSFEAAAILAVMNVPYTDLGSKFQTLRSMFTSWGYMASEDTEIASAFLAIGELAPNEVQEKLKYIVDQLKNYLAYPLVAAAILGSIPVFEAHEVLDLMEKAVTLLSAYIIGFERSQTIALAVRMVHGVRNELVREIDSTAKIAATPVQFTYIAHPNFFFWYFPVIVAHSSYHSTFSGMGGFHPAHSHGVGGFAG